MDLAIAPPLQARSRRTYEAILEATEYLLQANAFEDIAVAAIVEMSGMSVGSFYARFASKEALLPALYSRYEEQIAERGAALVGELGSVRDLGQACRIFVRTIAAVYVDNRNLMRAVTELSRRAPDAAAPISERRKLIHRGIEQAMVRTAPGRPEAALPAIRASQFMAVCALREAILYPHAPFAALAAPDDVQSAIARMMAAYIEGETQ
jgi:AcrR family transcriptional regulator